MHKTYLGVRIKTLREQLGLTQAALAQRLSLSPSYLNQIENNQRPLSVPVLLRLQSELGVDLQFFSEDSEARLTAQLQDVIAETAAVQAVPQAELRAMAQQMPALAQVLIHLHRRGKEAQERLSLLATGLGERAGEVMGAAPQAHEEVREYFYSRSNHVEALDQQAEALHAKLQAGGVQRKTRTSGISGSTNTESNAAPDARQLVPLLEAHLAREHGVTVQTADRDAGSLRSFDPQRRLLAVADTAEPGQRAFQLATQLAYLEAGEAIDRLALEGRFSGDESRALARIGLASYFAGALVLPYAAFLSQAEALHYDIDLLAQRFGVSFETVCHRLSSLQRPQARGVPFFFVRVDRAGNISKRQSATDFHFSHTGGTCPLWTVYEAFAQPGRVLTQVAQMPDGRTYLWIARCVSRQTGGYGSPARSFAIGLGCDVRHASRLVYSKGLDLADPEVATPIGAGCKVCERTGCTQRAFPALGRPLRIDENLRPLDPYASA